ncbi:helix-turn-helix domain-containing protein [Streptomyces sp. NPDC059096]|uniref:helix-turn-helix domain-containing protein n=1 Tax=unclassified Streptomyces TaxID=2593676 RepID=UPI00367C7741
MSQPRSGPTAALRIFAADLHARREATGLTREAAAEALGVHPDTVRRLEQAVTAPRKVTVQQLLRLYGTPDADTGTVLASLQEALRPGWWHPYRDILPDHLAGVIDLESAASLIRCYAPGVVPELLQTPDYARALLTLHHPRASDAEIERRVQLLAERRRHSTGRSEPARLWALIEEAVLARRIGSPEVMRGQIEHLERCALHPGPVTVQVVRTASGPHPLLLSGPFDVIRFDHAMMADRLVVRGLHSDVGTVTADRAAVRAYLAALDTTASLAASPTSPLPKELP